MSLSNKIRGGVLLANAFKEKGVEHVFTLAGGYVPPPPHLEGLWNVKCLLLIARTEQVAGHLADAHAE